jgi:hypothetical protein
LNAGGQSIDELVMFKIQIDYLEKQSY